MDHILSDLSTMARLSWVAPYGMATTPPRSGDVAERSNPMFKELQLCRCRRAERSYPTSEVRGGSQEDLPHVQGVVAARAQEVLEELSHVEGQEGQW